MALYHHYRGMCRQNYDKYLKSGKFITYKKYLYAMRGLVNAKFVLEVGELPEVDFLDMLDAVDRFHEGWSVAPRKVTDKLREIIRLKKDQRESDITENVVMLDQHIEEFLSQKQEPLSRRSFTDYLDKYVVDEVQK